MESLHKASYAKTIASKLQENETLQEQEKSHSMEDFKLGGFEKAMMDAIVASLPVDPNCEKNPQKLLAPLLFNGTCSREEFLTWVKGILLPHLTENIVVIMGIALNQ